ncbi:MAG TPA: hypothetical protein VGQ76_09770 [Thermoanaerobaculia bacterium]|nr:hypothetical protein [Thermoanaerobaculia bacterium]
MSSHPDFFIVRSNLPDIVDQTAISMLAAGTIDIRNATSTLEPGEYVALYVANDGRPHSTATVRPVPDGDDIVQVPADMTVVPLAVHAGRVTAVGEPLRVAAGKTATLSQFVRSQTGTTVLIEATVEEPWLTQLGKLREVPEAVLETAGGTPLRPMLPLRSGGEWVKSLLIFRNVPPGKAVLRMSGTLWQKTEASLSVSRQAVQILAPAIALAPSGALSVAWQSSDPQAFLSRSSKNQCNENSEAGKKEEPLRGADEVRLIACATLPPEDPAQCSLYASAPIEAAASAGAATFRGVPEGDYLAEVQQGAITRRETIHVAVLEHAEKRVILERTGIRGRVTRGQQPVEAEVVFGSKGRAVSDPTTGEYYAPIDGDFASSLVTVRPCVASSAYKVLGPAGTADAFDIELPDNSVSVAVLDTRTGKPVDEATVTYAIATSATSAGVAFYDSTRTDTDGVVEIVELSTVGFVEICADKTEYARACAPRFQLGSDEKKQVRVQLDAAGAREGRVVFPRPIEAGRIYFVISPGRIVASARIERDGRFTYELPSPTLPMYVAFFGRNLPLFLASYQEPTLGEPFTVTVPPSGRPLTIRRLSGAAAAPFTLAFGGLTVPRLVFDQHQQLRNRESRLQAGSALIVPDVAALGPVEVVMGPEVLPPDFPPPPDVYTDIFNTPGFAETLRRVPVGADGSATVP